MLWKRSVERKPKTKRWQQQIYSLILSLFFSNCSFYMTSSQSTITNMAQPFVEKRRPAQVHRLRRVAICVQLVLLDPMIDEAGLFLTITSLDSGSQQPLFQRRCIAPRPHSHRSGQNEQASEGVECHRQSKTDTRTYLPVHERTVAAAAATTTSIHVRAAGEGAVNNFFFFKKKTMQFETYLE